MFYNTTNEKGQILSKRVRNAETQEDMILAWFRDNPTLSFSPFSIQEMLYPDTPITSVRRALTNLTSQGKLIKTDEKEIGRYGMPNYKWKLKTKEA